MAVEKKHTKLRQFPVQHLTMQKISVITLLREKQSQEDQCSWSKICDAIIIISHNNHHIMLLTLKISVYFGGRIRLRPF